ncbi:MAG TPA: matrixin family metalloprotease [Opitutaceae bacterium]|nr:matrixin family metalloprotease [Opitutaceae bacterium]
MRARTKSFICAAALLCLAVGQARAYFIEEQSDGTPVPFWPNGTVAMQLQLDTTPLASPLTDGSTSWGQVAQAALTDWNSHISKIQLSGVANSSAPIAENNGYNNVFFSDTIYGQAWPTDVVGQTLYVWSSNKRIEADVIFNSTSTFDSYRGDLRYKSNGDPINDFKRVALHELGHALCLDHPDTNGQTVAAIMNSVSSNIDDLTADDIAGVQSAYGAPSSAVPSIATQPQGGGLAFGSSVTLSVTASGSGPFTYQWSVGSQVITGATSSTYTASTPGSYSVAVGNSAGSTTSSAALLTANSRLINVSSRAPVGTGQNVLIPGFVINGPAGTTKQVLIRASGPALTQFGVTGVLANPVLSLADGSGNTIANNTGWSTSSNATQIAAAAKTAGAFAFPANSPDSAILISLSPGAYTFNISGANGGTGVALAELYELNTQDPNLMINISARINAGTGSNTLIAGFVIQGSQSAHLLIRGDGPTLAQFGVTGVLAQPVLTVFDSNQHQVATNTGWSTNSNASAVASAASSAGAFALPMANADSALLLSLPPGAYTAQVTGANGTTGVALVEVYQVP